MIRVRNSVIINRPIDEVFEYCTNPDFTPRWQTGLKRAEMASPAPMSVGARLLHHRSFYRKEFQSISEVTEWEPPTRYYAMDGSGGPFAIGGGVTLETQNGHTKVQYEFNVQPGAFLRVIEPIVGAIFTREVNRDFQLLKSQLESELGRQPRLADAPSAGLRGAQGTR